jgi:hypothetical protein
MASTAVLSQVQARIWEGKLPLEIRLVPSECRSFDQSDPYLVRPFPVLWISRSHYSLVWLHPG